MARKTKEEAERTRQQIIHAARQVFHECGVSRTSLEHIAKAAGVTRGAVYWHFANKAELFFAMQEQASTPLMARLDDLLLVEGSTDPLQGIEQALKEFFRTLDEHPEIRQTFETMASRCEYVDEFAPVQVEVNKPAMDFLDKVEIAYRRAQERGVLRAGLEPHAIALDTWAFACGLFHHLLAGCPEVDWRQQVPDMIAAHIALRR
ncbi:MAG TPA: TetR family transcriptional regulator [Candidatus Competibacteraceae bacterium]|nr:MAG: TetR family transcriptional regulator [Candidatus Competibacteraceae bacterium]HOB60645.1 TetR family transcriptional regulator [Candidatus Competibacteraceae bacterium]HQA24901.1 TetR family transcriptional regulator [Candidatus Competibacteraceae bacterium]HQD56052.1 TetR family transcriptional regulator [Candidatus Competibacteraceae bacterium]